MAPAIQTLLTDHAERQRLERADGDALAAWTWDGIAAQQLALYRSLCGVPA